MASINHYYEDGWSLENVTFPADIASIDGNVTAPGGQETLHFQADSTGDTLGTHTLFDGGLSPTYGQTLWRFSSDENGSGFSLHAPDGDVVFGFGNSNPDFYVFTGNGERGAGSGDYDQWFCVYFEDIDYTNGEFEFSIFNEATNSWVIEHERYPLVNNKPIESLRFRNYSGSAGGWSSGDPVDTWFSKIYLDEYSVPTPQNLTANSSGSDIEVSWDDIAPKQSGYQIERSSDGSTYSNHVTVSSYETDTQGFEDMSDWSVNYGGQVSDRTRKGSYSFYCGDDSAVGPIATWTPYPSGTQPQRFSFHYQETTNSYGGGLRLVNSNGNYEFGMATDNPEAYVSNSSGLGQVSGGGNYDTWYRLVCFFDWSSNEVTLSWRALDNSDSHITTHTLKDGTDLSSVELWNFNSDQGWITAGQSAPIDHWWDQLQFRFYDATTSFTDTNVSGEYWYRAKSKLYDDLSSPSNSDSAVTLIPPSNIAVSRVSDSELAVSWDAVNGAAGYRIYRSQTSGSSTSDYTQVADVSLSSYTDSGLVNGREYFYRVTAYS